MNSYELYSWQKLSLLLFEGPQMRTVESSEALAIIWGHLGFHETQLTVLPWPVRVAIGFSFL